MLDTSCPPRAHRGDLAVIRRRAGPAATKQRVAINLKILPQGTFVLTPLQSGAVKRDSGTISGNWRSLSGRNVMRDGQRVTIFDGGLWTLTGKRGTLTIRERNEWVAGEAGEDSVAIGTWKVVRGTGKYAGITGSRGEWPRGPRDPVVRALRGLAHQAIARCATTQSDEAPRERGFVLASL